MQYVRSISGSLSSTWNSINPATLSGAIDVIVVEQEDGSLACSPFHIRFGKFSLLRPSEKKVEFRVNGQKQEFPMKLGEGGEAFFVFETQESVPEALQTSPLVSPATSPELKAETEGLAPSLQEPEPFELEAQNGNARPGSSGTKRREHSKSTGDAMMLPNGQEKAQSDIGRLSPLTQHTPSEPLKRPLSSSDLTAFTHLTPKLERTATDSALPTAKAAISRSFGSSEPFPLTQRPASPLRASTERSSSPPPIAKEEAKARALHLSKRLWTSNISNQVTESGDLMLDMTGFKSTAGEALHAEVIARQLLSEEMDGPYDIGALIGADEKGNVWIYSSEEAKEAAGLKAAAHSGQGGAYASSDAISDPGYHSDDARSDSNLSFPSTTPSSSHLRRDSDSAIGLPTTPPPTTTTHGDPNKNYAKTLRLTSPQLLSMNLHPGANPMSFTVNRATCTCNLWRFHHTTPIVISDIDGTITKSDVLGHVLNSIGRDWTHQGVAKLYTDIASNGYNFLYLTSRSVGQADMTRNYLNSVVQDGGWKLPKGPVILSPDRTIAALRREVYLRKPELFKMACLRDIMALFSGHGGTDSRTLGESAAAGLHTHLPSPSTSTIQNLPTAPGTLGTSKGKAGSPFYAGFGNRLTDALSYRSVNIPSTRIFTINSNSEVSLDLLSLNTYKTAYGSMREIVDHYFPPVGLLVKGGGEEYTDFNYWREKPLDVVEFTDSESDSEDMKTTAATLLRTETTKESVMSEDEAGDDMLESYLSDPRFSLDEQSAPDSLVDEEGEEVEELTSSMLQDEEEDGDDELGDLDDDEDEEGAAVITPDLNDRRLRTLSDREATPRQGGEGTGLGLRLLATDGEGELD